MLKISNPGEASVEEEVRSVGQSRRKVSLTPNGDEARDSVLDESVSSNNEIQKGQED